VASFSRVLFRQNIRHELCALGAYQAHMPGDIQANYIPGTVPGVGSFAPFLPLNWLPWQRPLRNRKKTGLDQESSRKYLPFGEKIVKIGPVDTEIALLIVKKNKKLTQAKYYSPVGNLAERAKKILDGAQPLSIPYCFCTRNVTTPCHAVPLNFVACHQLTPP